MQRRMQSSHRPLTAFSLFSIKVLSPAVFLRSVLMLLLLLLIPPTEGACSTRYRAISSSSAATLSSPSSSECLPESRESLPPVASSSSLSDKFQISGSLRISDSLLFMPREPSLELVSPAVLPAIEATSVPLRCSRDWLSLGSWICVYRLALAGAG